MPSRRSKIPGIYPPQTPVLDKTVKHAQRTYPSSQLSLAATPSPSTDSPAVTPPPNWPASTPYLIHPILSPCLPISHLKWIRTRPQPPDDLPVVTLPTSSCDVQSRVEIRVIEDPAHPACGQRGLFAAKDLAPGEMVVVYLGYVHGSTVVERSEWERKERERAKRADSRVDIDVDASIDTADLNGTSIKPESRNESTQTSTVSSNTSRVRSGANANLIGTWDASSYDLNMYRTDDIEIAVDASNMGNEARFVNDYRGVPAQTHDLGGDRGTERQRKGKRRVKGWEGENESRSETQNYDTGSGDGSSTGDWGSGSHSNGFDIAMPNAEFRDVWFDILGDIDLTLDVSSPEENLHHDGDIDDIGTVLTELRLNDASRNPGTRTRHDREVTAINTGQKSRPRRKKKSGIRGVAVFVMPAGKSGKRKGGIKNGQEVLVSYGKGFWAHHGVENVDEQAELGERRGM